MAPDDTQKIMLARKAMLLAVDAITREDSTIKAVLVATDGTGLYVSPLRLTKEETYALLITASAALEPETLCNMSGELH